MQIIVSVLITFFKAFVVGGGICVIAQLLINLTKMTTARILVSFLLAGALLQAVGLYEKLVDFAGAGATVPISGFGYLLADGAIRGAKIDLYHAITGGISAGAAGIASAIVFGYLFAVLFNAKTKKN